MSSSRSKSQVGIMRCLPRLLIVLILIAAAPLGASRAAPAGAQSACDQEASGPPVDDGLSGLGHTESQLAGIAMHVAHFQPQPPSSCSAASGGWVGTITYGETWQGHA